MQHPCRSIREKKQVTIKDTGSDPIRMPIFWQNVKLRTLKNHLFRDFFIKWNVMLIEVVYPWCTIFGNCNVFTLPIFKTKICNFFHCLCLIMQYIYIQGWEVKSWNWGGSFFVSFTLLIAESIAVLFWTGQKVLTPEKQASICLYIFKAELKILESASRNSVRQQQ